MAQAPVWAVGPDCLGGRSCASSVTPNRFAKAAARLLGQASVGAAAVLAISDRTFAREPLTINERVGCCITADDEARGVRGQAADGAAARRSLGDELVCAIDSWCSAAASSPAPIASPILITDGRVLLAQPGGGAPRQWTANKFIIIVISSVADWD